jgi:hypothetical protein
MLRPCNLELKKGRLPTFCGLATSRTLITTHNLELAKEGYLHSAA